MLHPKAGTVAEAKEYMRKTMSKSLTETSSTINPFLNRTAELTIYESIKLYVFGIVLIPIRIVLVISAICLAYIPASLSLAGLSEEERDQPLDGWRRAPLYLVQLIVRGLLLALGFYWIEVKGKPDPRARILVPNHVSFTDPLYFIYAMGPHFVAKKDVVNVPLIGKVFSCMQPILVERTNKDSRAATANEITRRAHWKGPKDWSPTVLFPEGTCANGTALIAFKYGAFTPGVPVQPVIIRYPFVSFDPSFVCGVSGTRMMLRLLSQFVNYMEIEFLPLYEPSEAEKEDASLFAANVRKEMAMAMNVTTTEHTYEDVVLQVEALKRNLPRQQALLQVRALRKQITNLNLEQMKTQMDVFSRMDTSNSGHVTMSQFQDALGLPDSNLVAELFQLLDVDQSGKVDFREFLAGKALIGRGLSSEESLRLAFDAFDSDKSGSINVAELEKAMRPAFPGMSMEMIDKLFNSIVRESDHEVTYDEFKSHMEKYPEYMSLFVQYRARRDAAKEAAKEKEAKKEE